MCGIVGLFFKRGAVNGGASSAARSRFAADSLLEQAGFELVVPRCVVGGRLADDIAESAASLYYL
jgi:hypothetical protein